MCEQTKSIEVAHQMRYPLPIAGTALQLFQLAELKGFGKEPDLAVSRVWDGTGEYHAGALFPYPGMPQ